MAPPLQSSKDSSSNLEDGMRLKAAYYCQGLPTVRESHSLYGGGGGEPGHHTCLGQTSRTHFYQHRSPRHHEGVPRHSVSLLFMCVCAFVSGFHVGAGGLGGHKRILDALWR